VRPARAARPGRRQVGVAAAVLFTCLAVVTGVLLARAQTGNPGRPYRRGPVVHARYGDRRRPVPPRPVADDDVIAADHALPLAHP
jgi:hypothetical protein